MALRIDMVKDIRKYEAKILFGLTKRQLICALIALSYSIPVWFICPGGFDVKFFVVSVIAMPVFLCGYVKLDGTYMEVLLIRIIYKYFLTPAKRKIERKNPYKQTLKSITKKKNETKKIKYSKEKKYIIYH